MEFKKFEKNNRKVEIGVESYTLGGNDNKIYTVKVQLGNAITVKPTEVALDADIRKYRCLTGAEKAKFNKKLAEMRATIGQRIATRRAEVGLSQWEVASSVGISQSTYQTIERGEKKKLDMEILEDIARVMDIRISYFFKQKPVEMATGTAQLYRGNDLEKALLISKLYLNSTLNISDFTEKSGELMSALDSLMLVEKISAILAS